MSLLNWNPMLSVKVEEMDREHQKLIDLMNTLNEAMKAGKGQREMLRTFDALATYTQNHFASEERYMRAIGYPDLEAHIAEHAALIETVARLKRNFEAGDTVISMKVMGFLGEWVRNHIRKSDMKYGMYAKQPA